MMRSTSGNKDSAGASKIATHQHIHKDLHEKRDDDCAR